MIKLGVVNFLNALPLWDALREHPEVELVPAMPSALAVMLREGVIDAGLLPVIEYFRNPRTRLLAGPCVAADGPVESVLLFHRRPLAEIHSLRLDANSRTSNALAQVLMHDAWKISPSVSLPSTPLRDLGDLSEDATVMIGDPAMRQVGRAQEAGLIVTDLAAEWRKLCGLPFVFAAWLVRDGVEIAPALFENALATGQSRSERYAASYSERLQLPPAALSRYLTKVIRYRWSDDLGVAVGEFGRRAASRGLCEARSLDLVGANG